MTENMILNAMREQLLLHNVELLIDFLIHLNDKGLINNHDFDYEKEAHNFANKDENKYLIICNVVGQSEQLCRTFLSAGTTTSVTKCRFCGKEKWEH